MEIFLIYFLFYKKKKFLIYNWLKKKNYNVSITKKYIENLLIEAKDLFRENHPNQELMHMIVNKYLINDKSYFKFEENLSCRHLALEIQFKSISKSIVYDK